ncbi:MAG: FixH family protein [Alphaproteobacteria bacterium]|nr:FixH family protein [Alphaproteobacteria bacterium]
MSETLKSQKSPKDKYILFAFLGFFGTLFLLDGIFVYTAVTTQTGVVTQSPYEKGLAYNNLLEEEKKQPKLKERVTYNSPLLQWKLTDENLNPIVKATVKARLIRPVQEGYDFDVDLVHKGGGVYEAQLSLPYKGQWVVKLESQWIQNDQKNTYKTTYHLIEK